MLFDTFRIIFTSNNQLSIAVLYHKPFFSFGSSNLELSNVKMLFPVLSKQRNLVYSWNYHLLMG